MNWQPIETAPPGRVLGWIPFGPDGGYFDAIKKDERGQWCSDEGPLWPSQQPSHWMIPEPPK